MARNQLIEYYNRYSGKVEQEAVYGEKWIRWAYGSPLGRLVTWMVIARPLFSKWYGWRMSQPASAEKIEPFIEQYGIDMSEAVYPDSASYRSFNDFFMRELRSDVRPVVSGEDAIALPADGRHLGFECAESLDQVFVKGQRWSLQDILGDPALWKKYRDGVLVLSRLCPVDYHHFHFPEEGIPGQARLIDGALFSVNPVALRRSLRYLYKNRRYVSELLLQNGNSICMVEIGATNVGTVEYDYVPGEPVKKGERKGRFSFGGSAVMTLFPKGAVKLAEDIMGNSREGRETYAHYGDILGNWLA